MANPKHGLPKRRHREVFRYITELLPPDKGGIAKAGQSVMPVKRIRESTIDTNFSKALRESYDYRCQADGCRFCGNQDLRNGGLECSHYYGRRYRGGRWHPDNCIALCHPIHSYIDTHPSEQVDLMRRHLGDTRHGILVERMQDTFKYTRVEKWEINEHYKRELKRLQFLRANGERGLIPLIAYD